MGPDFDYDEAELDVLENGGDPDYLNGNARNRDDYLRKLGLHPEDYGGDRGRRSSDSRKDDDACYLTTACIRARGLPDDCRELNSLRRFRDGYLKNRDGGKAEITAYYDIAPRIVKAVNIRPDAKNIWNSIYYEMILPCLSLIREGKPEEAYLLYKEKSLLLAKEVL